MNTLENLLKSIDLFGETLKLNFDKKKKFSTVLGGLFTLIIFSVTFALIINLSEILLYHTVPRTNSVTLFKESAPQINVSSSNLVFAFGFQLDGAVSRLNDPRYFSFSVEKYIINRTGGKMVKSKPPVPFDSCTKYANRWVSNTFNYTDQYRSNDVSNMLCFAQNNFTLEGAFLADYFENLRIIVYRCKNGTKPNLVCKSNAEIDAVLNGGNFQLMYTNRYIDVFNFSNPMVEFFDNYFIKIDPKIARFVDTYFQLVNITTDEGYVFEDKRTKSYAVFDYYREQFDSNGAQERVITLYINSSLYFKDVSRNYMKFTELAATVGGILNICLVIGKIIARYLGNYQMRLQLMNKLYIFDTFDDESYGNVNQETSNSAVKIEGQKQGLGLLKKREMKTYIYNIKEFLGENANQVDSAEKSENEVYNDKNEVNEPVTFKGTSACEPITNVEIIQFSKGKSEEVKTRKLTKEIGVKKSILATKHEVRLSSEGQYFELLDNIKKEFNKNLSTSPQSKQLRNKVFEEISKHRKSQKGSLKYGFYEILGAAACFCFGKNKKRYKILEIGDVHLNSYMDYLGIVKLLQEFEKLKSIIFDDYRKELFEHAKKPVIHIDENNLESAIEDFIQIEKAETNYEEVYTKYKEICLNEEKLDFDNRLIGKVDSELKLPFDMLISRERILKGKKWEANDNMVI